MPVEHLNLAYLADQAALCGYFAMLLYAALSDAASFRIPNGASLGLAAAFALRVAVHPLSLGWLADGAAGIAVFAAGVLLFARGWIGGGDVKFLAAVSLWAGPALLPSLLAVTGIAGGVLAAGAIALTQARRMGAIAGVRGFTLPATGLAGVRIPYGVAIAAGGLFAGLHLFAAQDLLP